MFRENSVLNVARVFTWPSTRIEEHAENAVISRKNDEP